MINNIKRTLAFKLAFMRSTTKPLWCQFSSFYLSKRTISERAENSKKIAKLTFDVGTQSSLSTSFSSSMNALLMSSKIWARPFANPLTNSCRDDKHHKSEKQGQW